MRFATLSRLLSVAMICCFFSSVSFGQGGQSAVVTQPPKLDESTVQIKLPAVVDDVVLGGAGRYVLYHFKSLRKVGVFDVNAAKTTKFITLRDAESKIAAGLTKLFVISGDGTIVSRYHLATGERELTTALDLPARPATVLIGNATEGPLVVSLNDGYRDTIFEMDLESFQTSPLRVSGNQGFQRGPKKVSANGETLTCWGSGSPTGLQTLVRVGNQWVSHYEHESAGRILPSADGKTLFTQYGLFTHKLDPIGRSSIRSRAPVVPMFPAAQGLFYLTLSENRDGMKAKPGVQSQDHATGTYTATLHMTGDERPLASVPLGSFVDLDYLSQRPSLSLEKLCVLVPTANLIVHLSNTLDEIIVTKFDIEAALANSKLDYLFAESRPASAVIEGQVFNYQIAAKSKSGGLSYSLASGPDGMKVSESGLVTWATSKNSPPTNSIIISIADKSGQEIFHSFDLEVTGGTGIQAASKASGGFAVEPAAPIEGSPVPEAEGEKIVKNPSYF